MGQPASVTALMVATYLRDHKQPAPALEALFYDPCRAMAYCRWPNSRIGWETKVSLVDRGFSLPAVGTLEPAT